MAGRGGELVRLCVTHRLTYRPIHLPTYKIPLRDMVDLWPVKS